MDSAAATKSAAQISAAEYLFLLLQQWMSRCNLQLLYPLLQRNISRKNDISFRS